MNTRHHNPQPLTKGSRRKPPVQEHVRAPHTHTGRVLVIETRNAAEDVIRVSIETVRSARPERIIAF
jgi:hypothetical protein